MSMDAYTHPVAKRRVNMLLEPELYQRVRRLADRLPGGTVTAVVEEALESSLPVMELAADSIERYRDDDQQAKRSFVEALARHTMLTLFEGADEEEKKA